MKQRQTAAESAALKVYQKYWESYLGGDLEAFSSTIDDRLEMIGTSEGEVCHSKADGIAFYKAQMAEVVGKVEMRNSQITSGWLDPLVLINETCDIYVKTDEGWNFYSKLRLSTLLKETSEGWKIVQQHGSLPDMRVADGETIAIEKISKENLELRDAINRRTIELEQKNRELEVEAALERVRSRSLAMHSSNELNEVVRVLFEKLKDLSIPVSAVGISINIEGSKDLDNYTCGQVESGIAINNYRLPYFDHVIANDFFEAREKQLEFFIGNYSKQEKDSFYEYVIEHTELKNELTEEIKQFIFQSPAYSISVVTTKHTMITLNDFEGKSLSDNEKDILKRFSRVFEQAYIRFLDLQKAEAQARESKIEAGLERVRSRSMAMHKSEELKDVIQIVYEQIVHLKIHIEHAGFIMDYKRRDDFDSWIADQFGSPSQLTIPYFDCIYYNRFNEAKAKGEDFFTTILSFEEKNRFYEELFEHIPDFPEESKNIIFSHPGFTISTVLLENVALYIENFTGIPFSEEENAILMRFGKVFQQSYTRFLDLRKAEAQAREAQIEAALERVRSRSMAMHRSAELRAVVDSLYGELKSLQVNFDNALIQLIKDDTKDLHLWISTADGLYNDIIHWPASFLPHFDLMYQARLAQNDVEISLTPDQINAFFEEYFCLPYVPQERRAAVAHVQYFRIFGTYQKNTCVFLMKYSPGDFSAYEKEIITRFSKVFEQTYTRFLDLQKAETQAREAQIEAALERVRAQTMAMHSSEDVGKCVVKMFSELTALGVDEGTRFGIGILNHDNENNQLWTARKNGDEVNLHIGNIDMASHPLLKSARKAWKAQVPFHKYVLEGEDLLNYYQMLNNAPDYKIQIPIEKLPKREIQHCFIFEHGFFYAFSPIEFQPELIHITKRFSALFEQTYRRYLDLVKAESQAREAQIEAALEKVRSRTMAMQSSDELADAAYVLFEQLNFLGVTHERINIGIVDEEKNCIDFWVTEQGGQKLQTKFSGRISEPTTLSKSYEAWKKEAKSLVVDLQGEELQSWLKYMEEEIKIPFNKAYLHNRRVQTAGFFSKGMLVVTSPEPLQNEALYLLEKFAGVFDLTHTRFSDLKLAEAQALQAEKDLIEIKIARQKAEEALAELKSTQAQLIQQEKLASLGQLTAGIAHEIKNPLNFVNNFSEVSLELLDEVKETRIKNQETRPRTEEDEIEDEILEDIKANLEKIHEHGTRANGIVTSMLQHSRGGSGRKEPTDLNALIKEYVNLSFHGMRAGKNPINVEIELDLDEAIKGIPLVREDFTRVIINLCNNAFDACAERSRSTMSGKTLQGFQTLGGLEAYHPKLTVRTKSEKDHILIEVADNGPGIPEEIKDKILQPFFTTKKGTEGTGLGLSITHDIVKAHGGELRIESTIGKGSEFVIQLPSSQTFK